MKSIRRSPDLRVGLTFAQQLDDLRRNLARTLIKLSGCEVGDRMRHHHEPEIGQAPGARHGATGRLEYIRNDRCRRNAMLLKYDTVEHTARAA